MACPSTAQHRHERRRSALCLAWISCSRSAWRPYATREKLVFAEDSAILVLPGVTFLDGMYIGGVGAPETLESYIGAASIRTEGADAPAAPPKKAPPADAKLIEEFPWLANFRQDEAAKGKGKSGGADCDGPSKGAKRAHDYDADDAARCFGESVEKDPLSDEVIDMVFASLEATRKELGLEQGAGDDPFVVRVRGGRGPTSTEGWTWTAFVDKALATTLR